MRPLVWAVPFVAFAFVARADEPAPRLVVDLGGGVSMEFARIPDGRFTMGSPPAEKVEYARAAKRDGYDIAIADEDQHAVVISKAFFLGKYPVTQQQYHALTGKNPSSFCASGGNKERVQGLDTTRFPVENVSWNDAKEYCDALAKRDGRGRTFRLPTEAEWEYACRGGTKTTFYWGDKLDGTQANVDGNYPFGGDVKGPFVKRPTKVGSYERAYPHPWGLADLHGNVWQWCADAYEADYAKLAIAVDPFHDGDGARVLRGGSWFNGGWGCRAALRFRVAPTLHRGFCGFRVLCRLDEPIVPKLEVAPPTKPAP